MTKARDVANVLSVTTSLATDIQDVKILEIMGAE